MTKRTLLLAVASAFLNGGCSRAPLVTSTVTDVTLFDSQEASHPSPRDSRWAITNLGIVAKIRSARRSQDPEAPRPACPSVGTIGLVDAKGATNRFFIVHIHSASSIRLEGLGDDVVVENGVDLLSGLAQSGAPTAKFFAPAEH